MTFRLDVVAYVSLDWSGVASLPSLTKEDGLKSMARCPRELLVRGMAAQPEGLNWLRVRSIPPPTCPKKSSPRSQPNDGIGMTENEMRRGTPMKQGTVARMLESHFVAFPKRYVSFSGSSEQNASSPSCRNVVR